MAVYVDDARILFRRMRMSHLVADTTDELLAMVDAIGVQRKWIQKAGTPREHFDVCDSKRTLAIDYGAEPVSQLEIARIMRAKQEREAGSRPDELGRCGGAPEKIDKQARPHSQERGASRGE